MFKKYRDFIILLICLIAIFQLYLYTTFPAFKNDDSPETITSTYTLGISHPPGYPLYTMAGKVFSLLPVGSPAFRVNSFAIFLAMLILFLSYFLIKQNTNLVFKQENKILNFLGVIILAFSYIFWNQAIEAKGGIFILNLLFFSILIYLGIKLFNKYNIKYLYMMSYIYGLSLANHWASMIVLLPVFGYFFLKYQTKTKQKNMVFILSLFILGISPYIYLPIRSGTDGIFIFLARPNTWENFWWTVLRIAYQGTTLPPSLHLYEYQIKEFFALLFNNYSFLWILMFAGGYIIYKRNKEIFYFYLSSFLIITFAIIFYYKNPENLLSLIDDILMPVQYILILFIIPGTYFVLKFFKQKAYKYLFFLMLIGIMSYMEIKSFSKNNARYNYLSYDFGNNIIKTMEPESFYINEGDFYSMPVFYCQKIENKTNDIKPLTLYSLQYEWGINDFIKKYGQINLEQNSWMKNASTIINNYISKNSIYFSYNKFKQIDYNVQNYYFKVKGLLYKVEADNGYTAYDIFKNYSYRGIFNAKNNYDKSLISLYSERIGKQAFEFFEEKKYEAAIQSFKYALLFPENLQAADFCYDLSFAYKALNDEDNQIKYLRETIKINKDYRQAYEILGMIYFNESLWPMAKEMLEKAAQYESRDKLAIQQYLSQIGNIDMNKEYEAIFNQAIALTTSGRYLKAMDLFGFLLEYNYKTAEIMQAIGNDPQLVNLYNQIQQAENKTK